MFSTTKNLHDNNSDLCLELLSFGYFFVLTDFFVIWLMASQWFWCDMITLIILARLWSITPKYRSLSPRKTWWAVLRPARQSWSFSSPSELNSSQGGAFLTHCWVLLTDILYHVLHCYRSSRCLPRDVRVSCHRKGKFLFSCWESEKC